MPQLTKTVIDRSFHKESAYMVWDDTIKGFGCKIHPTKKTFVYYFRSPTNKKFSYITIGVYGSITVDEARIQTKKFAHSVQIEKIDPRDIKNAKQVEVQQSFLFEDFWQIFTEKYMKERHKPSTFKMATYIIKLHIIPFFGKKPIAEIERKDILAFKDSLSHFNGTCTKCLRLLTTAFNQAELWEYIPLNTNPCRGIHKHPDKKMENYLTDEQLKKLEKTLLEREIAGIASPYTISALRLIIYTGCRKGEILSLKWEEVDLVHNCLRLKDSKTGKRVIPLNDIAKAIVLNIEKQANNPYVFCGDKPGTHLVAIQKTWERIRKQADLPDIRIHDLRHSFASFAINNGVDLIELKGLLGHASVKTTERYIHLTNKKLLDATNRVFTQKIQPT